jgi:hypothetical protein
LLSKPQVALVALPSLFKATKASASLLKGFINSSFVDSLFGLSTAMMVWLPSPTSFEALTHYCLAPGVPSVPVNVLFMLGSLAFHGLQASIAVSELTFSHIVDGCIDPGGFFIIQILGDEQWDDENNGNNSENNIQNRHDRIV